jgi:hypothetical protein
MATPEISWNKQDMLNQGFVKTDNDWEDFVDAMQELAMNLLSDTNTNED